MMRDDGAPTTADELLALPVWQRFVYEEEWIDGQRTGRPRFAEPPLAMYIAPDLVLFAPDSHGAVWQLVRTTQGYRRLSFS